MAAERWRSTVRSSSLRHPLSLRRNLSASSNGKKPPPPFREAEEKGGAEVPSPSSLFDEVRASLRRPSHTRTPPPSSSSSSPSLDEIWKNLSEFRSKSVTPPGGTSKERLSFESICDSLRQLRSSGPEKPKPSESTGSFYLKVFGESLNVQPSSSPPPLARDPPSTSKTDFMKMYNYDELGARLKKLRPPNGKGFSITELNNRLQKLWEIEEKESESKIGGMSFRDFDAEPHLGKLRRNQSLN